MGQRGWNDFLDIKTGVAFHDDKDNGLIVMINELPLRRAGLKQHE
jgi:hypothetical protein